MKIFFISIMVLALSLNNSQQKLKLNLNLPESQTIQQNEYSGKVAIVTGGSTGIGFETALLLAQSGAVVVFCARDNHPTWFNGSSAEQSINEDAIVKRANGSAHFFKADIRKPDEVRAFINFTHSTFGIIEYAVFNAGIGGYAVRVDQITDEMLLGEHDPIFNNLYGVLNCMRIVTKYWMDFGNPNSTYSIVALTSYNGLRACAGCDMYSASKHGIIGLVQSAAEEFIASNPKIRVNGIAPGLVNTFLTRNQVKPVPWWEGEAITANSTKWLHAEPEFAKLCAGGKLAEPSQISNAILFLLSPRASYISGSILSVDDGLSAK